MFCFLLIDILPPLFQKTILPPRMKPLASDWRGGGLPASRLAEAYRQSRTNAVVRVVHDVVVDVANDAKAARDVAEIVARRAQPPVAIAVIGCTRAHPASVGPRVVGRDAIPGRRRVAVCGEPVRRAGGLRVAQEPDLVAGVGAGIRVRRIACGGKRIVNSSRLDKASVQIEGLAEEVGVEPSTDAGVGIVVG